MVDTSQHAAQLQGCIERLLAGDASARDELIQHSCERLRRLTRKMLKGFPRVKRLEESDDVFQNAMVRLLAALREITPPTVADFIRLAAAQVRRELLDLVRQYFGPEGLGTHQRGPIPAGGSASSLSPGWDQEDSTYDPERLALWTEFHRQVDALPEKDREVFDLLWYHGLTQPEAAELLHVALPTVKRRWLSARRRLRKVMKGEPPVP